MNITELFKFLVGIFMTGLGLFVLLGFALSIGKDSIGVSIVGIILSLAMTGGGSWLIRTALIGSKKRKLHATENQVLKIAAINGGILTIAHLAMQANIPVEQAEIMLNTMQEQGLAQIQVDDKGTLIYEFAGLLR